MRGSAIVLALAAVLIVGACNSSSPTTPSLRIEPANADIAAGNSVQLEVIGGSSGASAGQGVVWTSSAPHIVSVSSNGVATAMYGDGTVAIRASVGGDTGEASVTALAACNAPAPLEGTPPAEPQVTQPFQVRFDPGVDANERAQELAQQIGFTITEITADGFIATFSVQQVSTIRCVVDVEAMTYL